jgi:peptide deformylase
MNDSEAQTTAVAPMANPIITPNDPERWPLLEGPSQLCSIPINDTDAAMIGKMDAVLDMLGDTAAGLAAVQIGYPKRIFLLRKNGVNRAFINPVIVSLSQEMKSDGEACLSLPGFGAVFKRPKRVELQYHELDGEIKREVFSGFWARAICHEMDHLNGVLIAHHLEQEVAKQVSQTKFGMKLTPHRLKVVENRRARNKQAKASRRANRG